MPVLYTAVFDRKTVGQNGQANKPAVGVDPGEVAVGVYQRTAGVARVDRGVGLDEVFIVVQAQLITPVR